ncbi:serine/threonine kinase 11 [Anaeramoeba flamelloides]|uniref:Serine/threonine kinase 11 n=1 Tax=Anaeramoeba flamelloides TaxID=1746091 RepID=A0ABQ8YPE1_9EUKA|nr:serine/threonine kinase 11 [Anaeramoeba flamelloides]
MITQVAITYQKKRTPKILNGYRFGSILGSGTFGKVREATHQKTNEKVAIKKVSKRRLKRIQNKEESGRKEIEVMERLSHLNVVKLIEVIENEEKGIVYLVMECANGGTLHHFLGSDQNEGKKLPASQIRYFFRQLIDSLEHCHSKNIVHRDVKPSNILLMTDFSLKLTDFGVAEILKPLNESERESENENQNQNEYEDSSLTPISDCSSDLTSNSEQENENSKVISMNKKSNNLESSQDESKKTQNKNNNSSEHISVTKKEEEIKIKKKIEEKKKTPKKRKTVDQLRTEDVGSPAIQPPEVARGDQYLSGFKADVWAAGVTLYFMITGKYPFYGKNIYDLYEKINTGIDNLPENISPELRDLLSGILKSKEDERLSIEEIKNHPWMSLELEGSNDRSNWIAIPEFQPKPEVDPQDEHVERFLPDPISFLQQSSNDSNSLSGSGSGRGYNSSKKDRLPKIKSKSSKKKTTKCCTIM